MLTLGDADGSYLCVIFLENSYTVMLTLGNGLSIYLCSPLTANLWTFLSFYFYLMSIKLTGIGTGASPFVISVIFSDLK